jgi:NAD+ synthase (glutamine-hydrolysing)
MQTMKIVLSQLNYHIGDLAGNYAKIELAAEQAIAQKADLIIFSELAICGYPPRDMLDYPGFMDNVESYLKHLAQLSQRVGILIGSPTRTNLQHGKDLYNSALFFSEGKQVFQVNKTLLPTYDIFDEARYFESNSTFELFEFQGEKIAIAICEDIWNTSNQLYNLHPIEELAKLKPDHLIVISASPFDYTQMENRKDLLSQIAIKMQQPVYYINQVGSYTDIIFDGGSMVFNGAGVLIHQLKSFEEDQLLIDSIGTKAVEDQSRDKIALIHDALILGIKDYFNKLNFRKAVVGLSGGIDSAVIGILAQRALGSENVFFVLMPSKYSSDHSIADAEELANNIKAEYITIGIQDIVDSFEKSLDPLFNGLPINLAEENIQARARGVLLMGISNKFGHILLNTSNKSEMSVGYSTLYGDMCGGLAALGDIYKEEVYALARYMNKDSEVIPDNIITKAPSAELRPDQKDADSLPDYDILDRILYQYIDERKTKAEIIANGMDADLVERILNLVNKSEYKRYQSPPVLKVSTKAFGYGRRMPIVAKYE